LRKSITGQRIPSETFLEEDDSVAKSGPDDAAEPRPAPAPLAIRLFGLFEVRLHGAPLPRLHSRKGEWLLALLTLRHGGDVARAWLAGALWPDSLQSQAYANLRNTLTDLRRALGPEAHRLRSPTPHTLGLELAGADVDVIAFDVSLAQGDRADWERAIALHQGVLLEGCEEEWVFQERQKREQAVLQALEHLATDALERGEPEAAEGHLRRAVAVDPLRESAQRTLMQALAQGGNYAAAMAVYRELRLLLHRELNLQPDPETTALHERIRAEARDRAATGRGPRGDLGSRGDRRNSGGAGYECGGAGKGDGEAPPRTSLASPEGRRTGGPGRDSSSSLVAPLPRRHSRPITECSEGSEATLTFLLTDIEGSTRLWVQHPEAMGAALARHDALLVQAIRDHGGTVLKQRGEGDSGFAVFSRATDAVAAALALQRALGQEPWPGEVRLRVRMALHTGEAQWRDGDYYGLAVNHCARLRAVGHAGQTLLSQTTAALLREHLPEGMSLRDLGRHRLKDLQRAESIYQLVHSDLPTEFPSLRSLEAFEHNLPLQLTRFIGRAREIAAVKGLLENARLLTLTGAGGCGKSRLALQVGADLLEEYEEGVWLVELAALSDGALVPQTVATALGVRETPGRALPQTLVDTLRPRQVLLLLDNCEHVLPACAQLTESLLQACPRLRVLATSREALGLLGEQSYRVPPLSLPEPRRLPSLERLQEFEAVQLFTDRAGLGQATFALTAANAASVVQVCQRLDGMPLAIELAAARVKALPVEKIHQLLDDMFRLLTGGSRTALPRHQTLRATIDWSYHLLTEVERVLLRRLSVFAGGWTLAAAEAVCAPEGVETWEVLDLLTSLVEKSLVLYEERGGEGRYRLLETVRQYARDRLLEAGEAEAVQRRHRHWFLALAEAAAPELLGTEQVAWLERLEADHDNFRTALERSGQHEPEGALRLAGALWHFWMVRGYLGEERERLGAALQAAEGHEELRRSVTRARALDGAGVLANLQGDYTEARPLLEESLAIFREQGDKQGIALCLSHLGFTAYQQGDYSEARSLLEESLATLSELGDKGDIAFSLMHLGSVAYEQGDYAEAHSLYEEGLTISRDGGNKWGIALSVSGLGLIAYEQGDYAKARSLFEESLTIRRELGYTWGIAFSLNHLGLLACVQGDYAGAGSLFEESLAIYRDLGNKQGIAESLESLARLAAQGREWERAVRLWGAAAALRDAIGAPRSPLWRAEWERDLGATRAALGEEAFAAVWAAGRALPLEEAVAYALESRTFPDDAAPPP
jgi:predicted ATPase/DNA-binding SARP family transcriptional activator/class 3 adenylate cyclase